MTKHYPFFLFILINSLLSISFAADRALLIGVGEYKNNVKSLPGVLLDIESMSDSARILGFEPENIKVLLNQHATLKNVRKTIKNWLIEGTSVEDKVLIYFTGHGSRIPDMDGDEIDGADEVLILYDSQLVSKNHRTTLENVLVDDELNLYLQQIKSHDLMLLVDACNSGTVYRGMSLTDSKGVQGKFLNYSGIPQVKSINADKLLEQIQTNAKSFPLEKPTDSLTIVDIETNKELNPIKTSVMQKAKDFRFVAITAAGDNELALATRKGSIFTQGINYFLKQAAINKQQITPRQLIDKVSQYIEDKVEKEGLGAVYQPQLAGNMQLSNKSISFVDPPLARVNWNRLEELDSSRLKLLIHGSKNKLILGESLTIDIEIPHQGYLNVITVGPDDDVFVLYPNDWDKKNLVSPGIVHLPTDKMNFKIKLTEPIGNNIMLAILTTQAINLYEQSIEGRDKSGQMFSSLKKLSASASKDSEFKNNTHPDYLSGKLIIEVAYPKGE